MNLARLFIIHAIITFAAGIVLIVAPEQIPATVNIHVLPEAYLVCYLLAAAELALAFLSYASARLTDPRSIRIIAVAFIVFHLATAAVEGYAMVDGASTKLWANIGLRLMVSVLFWYYGLRKKAMP